MFYDLITKYPGDSEGNAMADLFQNSISFILYPEARCTYIAHYKTIT